MISKIWRQSWSHTTVKAYNYIVLCRLAVEDNVHGSNSDKIMNVDEGALHVVY